MLVSVIALFHALVPLETVLPPISISAREEGVMRVHFLDVGQGDCTIVEFSGGNVLVVDAGDGKFTSRTKLLRYLKGLHPLEIALVATHTDRDHCGGFPSLLRTFDVGTFYLPSGSDLDPKLQDALKDSGVKTEKLTRYGVVADDSGAYAVCISPLASEADATENDASTVLFLSYGGVNFLLTGDISEETEKRLMEEYALMEGIFDSGPYSVRLEETDILKVPHHGSASSCSEGWVNLLSAETAIISSGQGNTYGHPSIDAMERLALSGADIYRTDELGDVVVSVKDGAYLIGFSSKET